VTRPCTTSVAWIAAADAGGAAVTIATTTADATALREADMECDSWEEEGNSSTHADQGSANDVTGTVLIMLSERMTGRAGRYRMNRTVLSFL